MECPSHLKVGIARNVREGLQPLNGLRINPSSDTTGWYFWAGQEKSDDPDFFLPLHVEHLKTWCPEVLPYLSLPPGWRFLIAPARKMSGLIQRCSAKNAFQRPISGQFDIAIT
jgi:hypothetical protein